MSTFWRALASRAFRRAAVLACSTPFTTHLSMTVGARVGQGRGWVGGQSQAGHPAHAQAARRPAHVRRPARAPWYASLIRACTGARSASAAGGADLKPSSAESACGAAAGRGGAGCGEAGEVAWCAPHAWACWCAPMQLHAGMAWSRAAAADAVGVPRKAPQRPPCPQLRPALPPLSTTAAAHLLHAGGHFALAALVVQARLQAAGQGRVV